MENPAGIDETAPRLSWILEARGRGRVQSAYQIVVSGDREGILSGRGDLWDTGKVPSSGTVHIEYAGRPLESGSRYYWRVRVWDEKDVPSPWSHVATWSMGLLQEDRWQGKWIGFDTGLGEDGTRLPLPPPVYLRKTFSLREPPGKASLYVTAMGLFEVYINGKRVGRDLFTPGWSSYRKRVYYRTYDVTDLLLEGPNAIGVILADGWYAGYVGFEPPGQNQWKGREFYGQTPALLLRLEMTGADGSLKALVSDESWRASTGPILEADILMGETYDARLEMPGWAEGGFDDSDWSRASPVAVPPARIAAYPAPPVREVGTVKPQKVTSPIPGVHVFDMGQNFAGRVRLRVSGKGGSGITLRYGEMLSADGTVMTQNLRSARAVDTYVLKGGGVEVWEPRFTYHGFRYLQVEGLGPDPPPETVTGVALSSDLEVTGSISSSSGLVDRLFEAIMRTQRSNFLEIPTDCPQRDERLGWSGDAHLFARTAAYNMDVAAFLTKWLEALRDDQLPDGAYPDFAPSPFLLGEPSPGWMDAGIIVPHIIYTMYADVRLLRRHYISMKKYMTYLEGRSEGFLLEGPMEAYGDWNGLDRRTSKVVIATAFFAWDARLMSEMARAIGEDDDAVYYASLFEKVRRAFTEAYVSPQGRIRSDTQTVYALALSMGLLDEALAAAAASRLAELVVSDGWRLTTGYIGTRFILQALTDSGKPEMALRLLLNRGFPSWGFMLDNGATTLWEKWDAYAPGGGMPDPRNTSFNHYALGSVGDWLYAGLAGIQPAEPGFRAITIRPTVFAHGIQHVRAEYLSVRGVIVSGWTVAEQTLRMKISIPPNTSASLHLPADKAAGVREVGVGAQDGKGVALTWPEPGRVVVKVGSGDYEFETTLPEEILRKTIPREPDTNGAGKGREAPWL